jgi:hypothetical protein
VERNYRDARITEIYEVKAFQPLRELSLVVCRKNNINTVDYFCLKVKSHPSLQN